ncbi:DoxX family protein [Planctomicrobium sp. SH664]|uniref:DoxX family protein n=1 Tax=Planctomicrobium sp. SH664 TaxID=3448125 RepID=UPI003F5B7CC2
MNSFFQSLGLLLLRCSVSAMMMIHGWQKIGQFAELRTKFPDPIGVGSHLSLILAIGAEFGCSILLILGIMTRLATIPLIITMVVIVAIVHKDDPWGASKELAAVYLATYVTLLVAGGGMLSFDGLLFNWWRKRRANQAMRNTVKAELAREAVKANP